MAVIYRSELSLANSSSMLNTIDITIDLSNQLIERISAFLSEAGNNLSGDAYTFTNAKLSQYLDALKKQNIICENLKSNIKSANNIMINYMENYDKIDDGEKEEIKKLINQINYSISNLESQVSDDEKSLKEDINKLQFYYNELNKYYNKIEELATTDSYAYSLIESVDKDISNYKNAINKVQVGWKNSFYNLGNRDVLYYDQRGHYVDGNFVRWNSDWKSPGDGDIYEAGCGPTSYAMVIGTMLHDSSITPETIANKMAEKKLANGPRFIYEMSKEYGVNCVQGKFDSDAIEEVINYGGGFIGSARNGSHYIAITDVVYIDGQRYFVLCDPWPEFNGNINEPTLITEEQLRAENISMDFYITPSNVEIQTDEYKKIISIEKN